MDKSTSEKSKKYGLNQFFVASNKNYGIHLEAITIQCKSSVSNPASNLTILINDQDMDDLNLLCYLSKITYVKGFYR